jgi:hypothetical protein
LMSGVISEIGPRSGIAGQKHQKAGREGRFSKCI